MTTSAVRPKQFTFPLAVEWLGGRRVRAVVEDKPGVEVMPPTVFRGTDPHVWSPEDFFVAAAASCLAVTFTGLVERAGISLASLHVDASGTCSTRDDGHFGFTAVQLKLRAVVPAGDVDTVVRLGHQAEEQCLVSASMALPVTAEIDVRGGCD
jgi:organic hydroperoxide reductase OsmC/OhrA